MAYKIAVFAGDGIGPEVVGETIAALQVVERTFGFTLAFEHALAGGCSIDAHGVALTDSALRLAKESDAVLLGAVGGPKWDDPKAGVRPEQAILALRKELGLFANLRPVQVNRHLVNSSTIKPEVLDGVDLVVVRELTGGVYYGRPSERRVGAAGREAVDTIFYTEGEVARLLRTSFELARKRRKKVTSVDKANIMATSRLWREVAHEVAKEYPDVQYEDVLVDAMSMHLIRRPRDFDVIAAENMFGDILTDEASMLAGSMGLLPSASLGEGTRGLYEPIHGTAPDIAGQDKANPLATLLSAALMLRLSLGQEQAAHAIEQAVDAVLANGYRTPDIAQPGCRLVGCREMGRLVRERLEKQMNDCPSS
jgi:3-isopropylmalate dehydrogenase